MMVAPRRIATPFLALVSHAWVLDAIALEVGVFAALIPVILSFDF